MVVDTFFVLFETVFGDVAGLAAVGDDPYLFAG